MVALAETVVRWVSACEIIALLRESGRHASFRWQKEAYCDIVGEIWYEGPPEGPPEVFHYSNGGSFARFGNLYGSLRQHA